MVIKGVLYIGVLFIVNPYFQRASLSHANLLPYQREESVMNTVMLAATMLKNSWNLFAASLKMLE